MGFILSRFYYGKEKKILILGLDNTGKTSILRILEKISISKDAKEITDDTLIVPTIGFNTETILYNDKTFTVWDLSGNVNVRNFWRCYFMNTKYVIYVIDSNDIARKEIYLSVLIQLSQEVELIRCSFLILLNKSELNMHISIDEIEEIIKKSYSKRKIAVFSCTTRKKESIIEAFDWLIKDDIS
ncbi:ADP-ribosylation factor [Hamiltosporidium magnivora]|uniref:ADP-ribosylation factor n=1 Tax=Hamiltosporidium magnivora TaxID=148818 RepID=A0A4Q9LNJ5_9MICR|nr:ADP-ribosylation factor [Hamiltosporidium magnivora]